MKSRFYVIAAVAVFVVGSYTFSSAEEDKGASSWSLMMVPGVWDDQAAGRFAKYDGFAWYKCRVTIPGSWRGKDLTLTVEAIDDAHEAYFNGVKLGGAGSFPPNYKSGLAEKKTYVVAAKLVQRAAEENIIAVRVFDNDGRGGFKGAAPVIHFGKQAIALNGTWEFRTGDDLAWAKSPTKVTSTAVFWRVMEKERAFKLANETDLALSPEDALARFTIPDDLELETVLAEPVVSQPTFFNFDERGRMWVLHFKQYPFPAGLKMVSRDKYWRAVYDKVPPPPPNHFRGADKITIHEDTNGDGVYDKHKTFIDGLSIATSFTRGRGGIWVLNPPYLMFYPDANNDDVPDGDPTVHLEGFGIEDTHSAASNLRWGPDGWLYGCQGSTVTGHIRRPGEKKAVHSLGQLIWRYHPESKRYEIFAEGGGNSQGLEFDSKGRVYSGHNGGNTRGFHYVQGGYFQKGFSKHGPLSNPFSLGYFPAMKHANVPRFTHDFIIYDSGQLPQKYQGMLFGVEPMQGQVVQSEITADGSSFQTRDIIRPIATNDKRFRPVQIQDGPDGAIYVSDMYEPQISHREHFAGQITKDDGRIYRLKAKGAKPLAPFDLSKKSTTELIALFDSPNKWTRQTVIRLLGDRKDKTAIPLLKNILANQTGQPALEALWALNLSGGFDEQLALQTLAHGNRDVRLWTVRLLCDRKLVSKAVAKRLIAMAVSEESVHVRSQLACSAKRLPAKQGLPIVRNLLTHSEDVGDVHLPLLLWWAIEAKCKSDSGPVIALFEDEQLWSAPMVEQHILERVMRRFAMADTRKDFILCARLFDLAPEKSHTKRLMAGFEAAFSGRSLASLPDELVRQLDELGGGSIVLGLRQGKPEAVAEALKIVGDSNADRQKRFDYVGIFGEVKQPKCVPVLLNIVEKTADDRLRMAALTALPQYSDAEIGTRVIAAYGQLSDDVRSTAHSLLSSRAAWTQQLLEAVEAGKIDKGTIPIDVVRKMTIHRGQRIAKLIAAHWGKIEGATTEEMQAAIAKYSGIIGADAGDPYRGKVLYKQNCGKCHILFGEGGKIGPDLTAFKRDDLRNMLANVINPSAEIREGFETFLVITEDGRAITGFLVDRDNKVLVLRGQDGQNVTIAQDSIEEMVPQKKSLMPEGQLNQLTDQQVRDLFAYLRSAQPLNN